MSESNHNTSIAFAKIGRPHGIKGAFFLKTADNRTQWPGYKTVSLQKQGQLTPLPVLKTYTSGNKLVVQLGQLNNRTQVEELYNQDLFVSRDAIDVDEDELLVNDIVGCQVYDENETFRGTVVALHNFGAQENLEIQLPNSQKTVFFPWLDHTVTGVDVAMKQLFIQDIPAFFEEDH